MTELAVSTLIWGARVLSWYKPRTSILRRSTFAAWFHIRLWALLELRMYTCRRIADLQSTSARSVESKGFDSHGQATRWGKGHPRVLKDYYGLVFVKTLCLFLLILLYAITWCGVSILLLKPILLYCLWVVFGFREYLRPRLLFTHPGELPHSPPILCPLPLLSLHWPTPDYSTGHSICLSLPQTQNTQAVKQSSVLWILHPTRPWDAPCSSWYSQPSRFSSQYFVGWYQWQPLHGSSSLQAYSVHVVDRRDNV